MPGSSLWLVPPPTHPLHTTLTTLITETLPAHLPAESSSDILSPQFFHPHMTLTSEIDPAIYERDGPQAWLDSIPLSFPEKGEENRTVKVRLVKVESQEVFYRRCFLKVDSGEEGRQEESEREGKWNGVVGLAARARSFAVEGEGGVVGEKTEGWLERWLREFGPHVSLMYGDVPMDEGKVELVSRLVEDAGVVLRDRAGEGGEARRKGGNDGDGVARMWDGWDGGVLWLVPTDRPIEEWKSVATRVL